MNIKKACQLKSWVPAIALPPTCLVVLKFFVWNVGEPGGGGREVDSGGLAAASAAIIAVLLRLKDLKVGTWRSREKRALARKKNIRVGLHCSNLGLP